MESKLMVICGPSKVGKSTTMHRLQEVDDRFVLIKHHMTRHLRPGEKDRVYVSHQELLRMSERGETTKVNLIYGQYHSALVKRHITDALEAGKFPMVDYKIPALDGDLMVAFPDRIFCVYMDPPSFEVIRRHMRKESGRVDEKRIKEDIEELAKIKEYWHLIDFSLTNYEDELDKTVDAIRISYLDSIGYFQ